MSILERKNFNFLLKFTFKIVNVVTVPVYSNLMKMKLSESCVNSVILLRKSTLAMIQSNIYCAIVISQKPITRYLL